MNALNELLEHEQYISRQVNTFLILCWNVSMSFHSFISGLYADRIYVSTAFMELLRILAKENERKLPYFDGMDLRLMLCKFNIAECYLVCFAI